MKLFTIPELAKLLNKSRQWIWFLVKHNDIPAQKVGGVYIIKESDLSNYLLPTKSNNSNLIEDYNE